MDGRELWYLERAQADFAAETDDKLVVGESVVRRSCSYSSVVSQQFDEC
jgi:hypothetical protein